MVIDFGSVGMALNVSDDDTHVAEATELEELGYSAVWLPGGQLDTLGRLESLVAATTAVPVAPAIIPPDVYDPHAVATTYARLERDHPGRFVVGLGVPHQARPLRALHEYLDRLDAADPPVPASRRILAALGPRMLEVARERCAGAVPILVTPDYTAWARQVLGEESALVVFQLIVGDPDPQRARETARASALRFLLDGGAYDKPMQRMGFDDEDIAAISDRLVDGVVSWGDEAAIATRVAEHLNAGADHVMLYALRDGDQPGPIEMARRLASRLVPTPTLP